MRSLAHLAIIAIACTNGSTGLSDTGVRTWGHVKILAADDMEGRRTGSAGHRRAAEYVAAQFRRAGLDPGGSAGFLERVDLVERRIDEARSSLTLVQDGAIRPLTLGEDAIFNLRGKPAPALEAPLVFAGYGLRIPSHGVDDLQGLDLKGKVVVAFLAAPTDVPGAVQAHFGSPGERWKTYRAAGAVGVAFIPNPFSMDLPWKRVALTRLEPYMALADPSFDEFRGQDVWVTVNPARAETFFEGSTTPYPALLALLKDGKPLPRLDLRGKPRAAVTASSVPISSDNVIGILRGEDRLLRDESVVVSAHLDHLGIGSSGGTDRIFNGAMDNAAGVAVLIETAARL
ncbi:MAG: M28 family peptidase, partial [Steroidobacteraceae bacterium]